LNSGTLRTLFPNNYWIYLYYLYSFSLFLELILSINLDYLISLLLYLGTW